MRDRGQINSPMAQLYYRPMNKNLLLLQKKLNRLDCEYADLRCVQLERVKIRTHKAALDEVKETHSTGIGFRVLKDGAFGFSSTYDFSEASLLQHLNRAYEMAKRFSKIRHTEVKLIPAKPVSSHWQTPIRKDPWSIPLQKKIAPLIEAEKKLISHSGIDATSGCLDFARRKVIFISTEGSWIEQLHYRTGGWISGETLISGSEKIKRSWPGPSGAFRAQGYEAIEAFQFEDEADRLTRELNELKTAPEAPSGTFDLILRGSILALQLHETFGHASESDRLYGYEDNFGGRTLLNPGLLGGFPAASPQVTIVSNAGLGLGPGAGSFAYDDEGTPARSVEIIKRGFLKNYLTSRETAFFLSQDQSSANMIAEDWSHYPLIRMTNLNLLPGRGTLAQIIRDTKEGILIDNELSWSIDEMRLDFQIGGEMGYHIQKGKVKNLIRYPIYYGNTLDFWRSCDRVSGKKEWDFWGFSDCGKGGPYQEAFTGHGVSAARFRDIQFRKV